MRQPPEPTDVPEQIGPFKILGLLGEGGMGTVYLAEQKEPVRRRVALKVIKLGMDTRRVLARFEVERQALALMEHDGIARVYDAGATDAGQPYFAMEHVKGVPITQYCDTNNLGVRARLELFTKVCGAIQHAHHKGVIHRDLTPRNVMVAVQDGAPQTKIIDFGLARATNQALTDKTLYTEPGVVLGTPEYMSPEQAGFDGLDVDTRTDVYSLGMILYELLVGELPFSSAELRSAGPLEAQRVIREQDPPRPSSKLTTSREQSAERARRRSTDVADLHRRLRGDLDWIVMKALEKDRTRRYGTVESLADDVRRYLDGDTVLARPPTVGYRVAKFVRRNRGAVVSAALLLATLLAGLVGTGLFALEASRLGEIAATKATEAERRSDDLDRANDVLAQTLQTTRALGLASAAQDEVRTDPTRALLLALEAIGLSERVETRSALHHALALCDERRQFCTSSPPFVADALPDGSRFVTGSLDGVVRFWSRTGELMWERSVRDGTGPAAGPEEHGIMLSRFVGPDRDRILAGDRGGELRLWDLQGRLLDSYCSTPRRILPYTGQSPLLSETRERILLGMVGAIQILDLTGPARDRLELVQEIEHAGKVNITALHPDGSWFAAAESGLSRGGLWKRDGSGAYTPIGPLLDEPGQFASLAFAGSRLLVGTNGGSLVHDLDSHAQTALGGGVDHVGWLAGGRIVGSDMGGSFTIWDASLRPVAEPRTGTSVLSGEIPIPSSDGLRFAVGYQDGLIKVFDSDGNPEATLVGHPNMPAGMLFVRGDRELFSWSISARLWDLADTELAWQLGRGTVKMVRYSPDGKHLLTNTRSASLWDARRELVLDAPSGDGLSHPRHAFSSDSARLATVRGRDVQVYDTATGNKVFELVREQSQGAFCVLPQSTELLLFDRPATTASSVVDFETGQVGPGPTDRVFAVAPSPSGRRVALWRQPSTAAIYERRGSSWGLVAEAPIEPNVYVIAYSPDEQRVLFGTADGQVLAFDRDLQPRPERFVGHRQRINDVRYSRDGSLVATASADGTARLWDRDGTPIAVLEGPIGEVVSCEFTPDGQKVLTGGRDGTVRWWFVHTADLLDAARARLSRELTADERARFADLLGR